MTNEPARPEDGGALEPSLEGELQDLFARMDPRDPVREKQDAEIVEALSRLSEAAAESMRLVVMRLTETGELPRETKALLDTLTPLLPVSLPSYSAGEYAVVRYIGYLERLRKERAK